MIRTLWNERRRFISFVLVGGISAIIDAGVFWILTAIGVWPALATVIGYVTAFTINYRGNSRIVFRAHNSRGSLWKYVALVLFNLALSTAIVEVLVLAHLLPIVAKLISMVVIAIVNFIAMRNWVFRHQPGVDRVQPSAERTAP